MLAVRNWPLWLRRKSLHEHYRSWEFLVSHTCYRPCDALTTGFQTPWNKNSGHAWIDDSIETWKSVGAGAIWFHFAVKLPWPILKVGPPSSSKNTSCIYWFRSWEFGCMVFLNGFPPTASGLHFVAVSWFMVGRGLGNVPDFCAQFGALHWESFGAPFLRGVGVCCEVVPPSLS